MKASLFITCLADHFYPQVGLAVVHLLRRCGVEVDFPEQQTCCGQVAWNTGHQKEARQFALNYLRTFEKSEYIIMPSGSCAGHVRYYYPKMFPDDAALTRRLEEVASRTYEFSQFMVDVLGVTDVGARYPARAVFHNNCHMQRELGVKEPPLMMLRAVRDLELMDMPRPELCCGFGGAFSIKQPAISTAMADQKLAAIASTGADLVVSCDAGCLMHQGGRNQRTGGRLRFIHLADLLWQGVKASGH